jgi:serine/threonine protein phosphatase PrpC
MRFSVYQESHIGGRKINQDRMGYSYTRDALLLLLADGLGGHIRGEQAATIALQTIGALFQQQASPHIRQPERFLKQSLLAAHREIHRYRAVNQLPESPRTTIVACLIQHDSAYWAHCGDSRLYWLRHGQILSCTRDHSRIETLIAQGKADASERNTHPERHQLFNCLGAASLPIVDISPRVSLCSGDVILLCSDGLWSVLPGHDIAQRLCTDTIMRAVPEMIADATRIAGGSGDNTTALAIMWEGSEANENSAMISTQSLPVGSVTTTIQAPRHADMEDADPFSEHEIEKAIEEIRRAIEKSSTSNN